MDPIQIIGQAIGFVAITVAVLSFQAKRRSSILLMQAVANIFWTVHFFMIAPDSPSGYILNAVCVFRNIIYSQKGKWRFVNSKIVPLAVSAVSITLALCFAKNWLDYFLIPSTIVSSVGFYLNDEKKIRIASSFVALSWLVNNIIVISISGMLAEIFNLVSITVAMIRYSKIKASLKECHSTQAETSDTATASSAEEPADKQTESGTYL